VVWADVRLLGEQSGKGKETDVDQQLSVDRSGQQSIHCHQYIESYNGYRVREAISGFDHADSTLWRATPSEVFVCNFAKMNGRPRGTKVADMWSDSEEAIDTATDSTPNGDDDESRHFVNTGTSEKKN
jgi:hypothetical protein